MGRLFFLTQGAGDGAGVHGATRGVLAFCKEEIVSFLQQGDLELNVRLGRNLRSRLLANDH
jgi:hypothetical protein